MKKTLLSLLLAASLLVVVSGAPAHADETPVTLGVATWFAWMDTGDPGVEIDPFFLYGPSFSMVFSKDLSLSAVGYFGMATAHQAEDTNFGMPKMDYDLTRIDADIALNYKLGGVFKAFLGCKLTSYSMSATIDDGMGGTADLSSSVTGIGPALGVTMTMPLSANLFLLGSVSGNYLFTSQSTEQTGQPEYSESFHFYGYNATLSLAFFLDSAGKNALSLGGRLQSFLEDQELLPGEKHEWSSFYGITLSFVHVL
jgi:hypothetical protein